MGVSADSLPPDVTAALIGGGTFDQRLSQLMALKNEIDAARATLKTDEDAAQVLAEARRVREEDAVESGIRGEDCARGSRQCDP